MLSELKLMNTNKTIGYILKLKLRNNYSLENLLKRFVSKTFICISKICYTCTKIFKENVDVRTEEMNKNIISADVL